MGEGEAIRTLAEAGGPAAALLVLALFIKAWLADMKDTVKELAAEIRKHDKSRADFEIAINGALAKLGDFDRRLRRIEDRERSGRSGRYSRRLLTPHPRPVRVGSGRGPDTE